MTANKQVLCLLIDYSSCPGIIKDFLPPPWKTKPYEDIPTCLIRILLHFIGQCYLNNDEEIILWIILQEPTADQYSLVIQYLFGVNSNKILSKLKTSFPNLYEKYIDEIPLHRSESLEFRSIAFTNIDQEINVSL